MRRLTTLFAVAALAAILPAQNTNQDAPRAEHKLPGDERGDSPQAGRADTFKVVDDARDLYGIRRWGGEHFDLNEAGEVTVKLHVKTACRKLGAKNRTQAALAAKEVGLF